MKTILMSLLLATTALADEADLRTEIEVLRKELAAEEARIAKLETTVSLLFANYQLERNKQVDDDLGRQQKITP